MHLFLATAKWLLLLNVMLAQMGLQTCDIWDSEHNKRDTQATGMELLMVYS